MTSESRYRGPLRELVSGARGLLGQSAATGILKVASAGLGFWTSIILGRALEPAGFGLYAAIISIGTVLTTVFKFGLDHLAVREVSARTDPRALVRSLMRVCMILGVVAGLVMALLLSVDVLGSFSALPNGVRLAAGVFVATQVLLPVVASVRAGLGRVVSSQTPHLAIYPLLFIAGLLVSGAIKRVDLGGALTVQVLAALTALGVAVFHLRRRLASLYPRRRVPQIVRSESSDGGLRTGWLGDAGALMATSALFILSSNADILMLSALDSPEAAGTYRVATRGAELVTYGAIIVRIPLSPLIAREWSDGNPKALQRLIRQSGLIALIPGTAAAIGLAVWATPFLSLFGEGFSSAGTQLVLRILLVSQFVNVLAGPTVEVMSMTGHERHMLRAVAISTGLNVGLNFALIPAFGPLGAGLATGFSLLVWNCLLVITARRVVGLTLPPIFPLR